MFDRLEDLLKHYEELMLELNEPSVADDQKRFRKLMKEQADLSPIVEAYRSYKKARENEAEALELLETEKRTGCTFTGRSSHRARPIWKTGDT